MQIAPYIRRTVKSEHASGTASSVMRRGRAAHPCEIDPVSRHSQKRVAEFVIERNSQFPCAVQLMRVVSPALISAPAIAEQVRDLVAEILGQSFTDASEFVFGFHKGVMFVAVSPAGPAVRQFH